MLLSTHPILLNQSNLATCTIFYVPTRMLCESKVTSPLFLYFFNNRADLKGESCFVTLMICIGSNLIELSSYQRDVLQNKSVF